MSGGPDSIALRHAHPVRRTLKTGASIEGCCDPRFAPLLDAFAANFEERGEVGASLCVIRDGQTLVDLWGGIADSASGDPWQENTAAIVFSCTKGAAALCLHLLVQDGALAYDDLVEHYWPGFARGGKGGTTIAMLLDHRAPVPHFRGPIAADGFLDWDYMVRRVEDEAAYWKAGTRQGYHGVSYAWTVGQMVRLIAGKPLAAFFKERVADPLNLPFSIGLPQSRDLHLARIIKPDRAETDLSNPFYQTALSDRASPAGLFLFNSGGADFDTAPYHRAEIASANGITNARGLAALYQAMIRPGGLLSPPLLERLKGPSATCNYDEVLCRPSRFSGGFMKAMPSVGTDYDGLAISAAAFGHVGMGGSLGFADQPRGISFGYMMNRLGPTVLLNPRGQSLVDSLYRLL